MTALEIAANLPTVSSLLMYPTCRPNRQSSLGRANNAVSFEQSIFSEIHESKTFSTAFPFDSYLALHLYVIGVAVGEVTDTLTHSLTHARTHQTKYVTLAAHARRGLITIVPVYVVCGPSFHTFRFFPCVCGSLGTRLTHPRSCEMESGCGKPGH